MIASAGTVLWEKLRPAWNWLSFSTGLALFKILLLEMSRTRHAIEVES
jgi:hypothetical protein